MIEPTESQLNNGYLEAKDASSTCCAFREFDSMPMRRQFVEITAESATNHVLEGATVEPEAKETKHEVVAAMIFGTTASEFLEYPQSHPTSQ